MNFPKELKYSKEHTWAKIEGDTALIGISDFAQDQLGEILFVEMPDVGDEITQGVSLGVVESSKKASDVISPLSGEVLEINEKLDDEPEYINENAYDAWIVKIKVKDSGEVKSLVDASEYEAGLK
ncbi:glycine cleavage system protein GcvH [Clostridium autoethanogenum]|jgi:glycine cleavage system H protein|uniref:Glycine cleavage system H protein n=2 Tax=Clostridium autoethanogenum TaxID=84023 RepID=F8TER0_9CLOT|nr:glycine cleavage system protein GcvH [Clostridium autoethanogenum]AEI90754.1 glycine cleavage system H protein [Clostridium autoethanogenum DSM 10061]AGY75828.1 glycine cleavage system protein GcvH [Clostridium autoethanogenum DSM 10061]ALU35994.1 Glycine cleavage system H protein [Clostridium autoethanogenum DSM 10061]OVY51948.1 Glycine cleavage system H protein [Clostridium autoethanogenum]RMC93108.1 glycine cleavage system protein GcvH [Clostridium autoethanogenum]